MKNVYIPVTAKHSTCVVVMSGGQDSTTCLGLALQHFKKVVAINFSYGQKHEIETFCAANICKQNDVPMHIFKTDVLSQMGDSALFADVKQSVNEEHSNKDGLPASFVPNRNAFFLTVAHAYAQKIGASFVMTGVCQTDYSGYPDCRDSFVTALNAALNEGSNSKVEILTPLMYLTKAETFKLAEKCDFIDTVINDSHTCYNGRRGAMFHHEWGHGCGECPACELRSKGWDEYLELG